MSPHTGGRNAKRIACVSMDPVTSSMDPVIAMMDGLELHAMKVSTES